MLVENLIPGEHHEQSQAGLVESLSEELALASRAVTTAESGTEIDWDLCQFLLSNARTALENVRRFEGSVKDEDARERIHARADHLNAAIRAFRPPE